jgi:dipeptidyl aminopeptidase/acylaminoacyl peptidase
MNSFIKILITLLFLTNLQTFSKTPCESSKTEPLKAGEAEKIVYKQYEDKDKDLKQLHISLVRPADAKPGKKRPLIIGAHGSGFINFCLFDPCYQKYGNKILAPNFAPQGYLTASVEYRLNSPFYFKPPRIKDEKLKEASYKAVQDFREAVRFIFENAEKFGVDKENVFLMGTSAGAITVLNAAFLDNDEVPQNLIEKYGRLAEREKIKGVISLSGAISDLSSLAGGEKVPLMIVHGTEDSIVPVDKGFYLKMKHLTPVYGSRAIAAEAEKMNIPVKKFFYDSGHDYERNDLKEIFKNANDFIRSNLSCPGGTGSVVTTK